jgi:hypothetical protein
MMTSLRVIGMRVAQATEPAPSSNHLRLAFFDLNVCGLVLTGCQLMRYEPNGDLHIYGPSLPKRERRGNPNAGNVSFHDPELRNAIISAVETIYCAMTGTAPDQRAGVLRVVSR